MNVIEVSEEKERLSQSIERTYLSLQKLDKDSPIWEYNFNTLFHSLFTYMQTFVFRTKAEKQYFLEGADYFLEKKGKMVTLEKIINLAKENLSFQDFFTEAQKIFKMAAGKAKRNYFWFLKSGGAIISQKNLRKIARGEGKIAFSMEQEYSLSSEGKTVSLFDNSEVRGNSNWAREDQLPDFLENSRINDFGKIMEVTEQLYQERTSGKSDQAREKAETNSKSPKVYYRVLLTALFLKLYEAMKVIPYETFRYMLERKSFMDQELIRMYEDKGIIPSSVQIARQFGFTEQYLSGRKKDFLVRLKKKLQEQLKKNNDFFSSSTLTGYFTINKGGQNEDRYY